MNIPCIAARIFLFLSVLLTPMLATAGGLHCKVVEVTGGDTLTVINGGGYIKVRLKAIDAPEAEQPWGASAHQHLSNLVLGKEVMVQLTGLNTEKKIVAIVYLNKMDIGQQMIRDGVAWYDHVTDNGLGLTERRIYQESEQAARSERRGIWQDESPVPPWEFREAQARQAAAARAATVAPKSAPTNGNTTTARSQKRNAPRISTANWQRFAPEGEGYSVLLPPVQVESMEKLNKEMLSYYYARSDGLIYDVLRRTNPEGESPDALFNNFMLFQDFVHRASRQRGVSADIYPQRDLPPVNGYAGKQYEIFVESIHALVRVYIGRRDIYIIGIVGGYEGDPRVDNFLASFTINKGTNVSATGRKPAK